MSNEYGKVKTASKIVVTRGKNLQKIVLDTMHKISSAVGATLGPGGLPVVIERTEQGLPNIITKDGVTVFRHLGYSNSIEHLIMETARDAAIRTASDAGDGTTTATVLSEAIVRNTVSFCERYPKFSPQKVNRIIEKTFREDIEPLLKGLSRQIDFSKEEDRKVLHSVAKVSANGDSDLADAVLKCFEIVGDEGNVTITEQNGPSHYEVEKIKGYPIGMGYEECCARYYPLFINDPGQQRVVLEKPIFVIYHGVISEVQTIEPLFRRIGDAWQGEGFNHNVVLVATGFSDTVLGTLAMNFVRGDTINVFPLLAPKSPIHNGQLHFLEDIAAVAGTYVFNPITRPLESAELEDFGSGVDYFEASRYRSNIVGHANEDMLLQRLEVLKQLEGNEESILEKNILQERIGKITGGIARLKVIGASNGELREKKDRADDAVCAVRGALRKGCLPGGGWALLTVADKMEAKDDLVCREVIAPSLRVPVDLLLTNAGLNEEEKEYVLGRVLDAIKHNSPLTYDALEMRHVDAFKAGILDSTPAVVEALRNSLSIAANLGTLGGAIAFPRDNELDREEARKKYEFDRMIELGDHMSREQE